MLGVVHENDPVPFDEPHHGVLQVCASKARLTEERLQTRAARVCGSSRRQYLALLDDEFVARARGRLQQHRVRRIRLNFLPQAMHKLLQ